MALNKNSLNRSTTENAENWEKALAGPAKVQRCWVLDNALTNPVIDQNHVHWLSDGIWLKIGEITRSLRCKASYPVQVTQPMFWSRLVQRSTKSKDIIVRVDISETGLKKLARLICHVDYIVLAKTNFKIYLYNRLQQKADDYTLRPSARRTK